MAHRLRHLVTAYEIWAADDNWAFFEETEGGLRDLARLMRTFSTGDCASETATFAATRCTASLERRARLSTRATPPALLWAIRLRDCS